MSAVLINDIETPRTQNDDCWMTNIILYIYIARVCPPLAVSANRRPIVDEIDDQSVADVRRSTCVEFHGPVRLLMSCAWNYPRTPHGVISDHVRGHLWSPSRGTVTPDGL